MRASKLQRLLFWLAWAVAFVLLGRFAIDFIREMPGWLAAPFVLLVAAALGIAAMNIVASRRAPAGQESTGAAGVAKVLLIASIPLGFFASSLDCTGLSLAGCTPFCTFIKTIWIPVLAVGGMAYFWWRTPMMMLLGSAVPLAPHCLCFNPGNGWWIERLGASPTCYAWGFVVSLIALSALGAGKRAWLALFVNGAIIGGATAFFVGHHYFHFPW
ncbi:MAG: hypothetical protein ACJ74G_15460 [Blastocatellia bacterium]